MVGAGASAAAKPLNLISPFFFGPVEERMGFVVEMEAVVGADVAGTTAGADCGAAVAGPAKANGLPELRGGREGVAAEAAATEEAEKE
jgi:hypothetical protein